MKYPIIRNLATIDNKPLSYLALREYACFLEDDAGYRQEIIEQKNLEIIKLHKDMRRLDELNIKLYASKNPDICEHFIDCSVRNTNCIVGDNPQRQACKRFIEKVANG